MKQIQSYTYTIPANGSVQIPATNDNFIVQAATGPVTVRGDTFGTLPSLVAGQGLKAVIFNRLELKDESGAPNTVTLLMSPAEFVNQVFSGSVAIVGGVSILGVPVVRTDQESSAWWNSTATMGANGVLTVFNAAANPNGAIIHHMEATDSIAAAGVQVFLTKATLPATVVDGNVIAQSWVTSNNGANANIAIRREQPIRIPGGVGLYFVSGLGGAAGFMRSCSYRLL